MRTKDHLYPLRLPPVAVSAGWTSVLGRRVIVRRVRSERVFQDAVGSVIAGRCPVPGHPKTVRDTPLAKKYQSFRTTLSGIPRALSSRTHGLLGSWLSRARAR